jgi:hypothetical protein
MTLILSFFVIPSFTWVDSLQTCVVSLVRPY